MEWINVRTIQIKIICESLIHRKVQRKRNIKSTKNTNTRKNRTWNPQILNKCFKNFMLFCCDYCIDVHYQHIKQEQFTRSQTGILNNDSLLFLMITIRVYHLKEYASCACIETKMEVNKCNIVLLYNLN